MQQLTEETRLTVADKIVLWQPPYKEKSEEDYGKCYQQRRLLGEGGYGAAWLVIGTAKAGFNYNKTLVAKVNHAADRGSMALLETGILRQIDHRNVVRTVDEYKSERGPISILELCIYGSLAVQLKTYVEAKAAKDAFPEELVVKILADLAAGLMEVHETGIVHLDMKPDNILIDAQMDFKLADFGIAMLLDSEGAPSLEKIRGTQGWRAPETREGKKEFWGTKDGALLSTAADVWGLGCVMYTVCTILQRKNKTAPYASAQF